MFRTISQPPDRLTHEARTPPDHRPPASSAPNPPNHHVDHATPTLSDTRRDAPVGCGSLTEHCSRVAILSCCKDLSVIYPTPHLSWGLRPRLRWSSFSRPPHPAGPLTRPTRRIRWVRLVAVIPHERCSTAERHPTGTPAQRPKNNGIGHNQTTQGATPDGQVALGAPKPWLAAPC